MKQSNKHKIWKTPELYFILILMLLSCGLITQLLYLQILPIKYTIIIIVLLVLISGLMYILQFSKKVNKFNKILGKVIIAILCVALGFGNYYAYKGGKTLSDISGSNLRTDALSVIVLKDKEVNESDFETMKDYSYGILSVIDRANTDKAVNEINDKTNFSVNTKEYNSMFDLAQALYDENVDAIILNEAYRGTYQDNEENKTYEKFDSETKVIYQISIESEIEDISKNVNVVKDPFNVFISGIDTYGSVSTASRSDVNMLATINPTTKTLVLTSIPRDYYVAQPCQGNQLDKLTHAGIFGVECSVTSIENLFDININYYARVNFTSLIEIVDALGGINVNNPTAFSTGQYFYDAGDIYLTGEQALAFSRDRYHQEGGDRGRGKNQMRVITGIVNKAISPSIITNYSSVMNAISGCFQTNMESNDITKLIQKQLNDMEGWNIIQNSVDGTGGTDWTPANGFNAYVMYPDQSTVEHAKDLINQVMNGQEVIE